MSSEAEGLPEPIVQIVGPADDWILERLARRLVAKLPYAEFVEWEPRPRPSTRLVYYVNYALFREPSGCIDVGFFTHNDESQGFLERARKVDFCVCMAKLYADWLRDQGIETVAHIPMAFDAYRFRPRLVLGVVGKLDHPRKGKHLVERLRSLPFVEVRTTEGRLGQAELWSFYQAIDYVLIPALVEGGPMSLLEGLSVGKPVIAPEGVGLVPEFNDTEHIHRYPAGDAEALLQLVGRCYEKKSQSRRLVEERSWDRWAEDHRKLFGNLLQERGFSIPTPAPGFRFGLLQELDVPLSGDVEQLEATVDRTARLLYFGKHAAARAVLEESRSDYPCLTPLLHKLDGKNGNAANPQTTGMKNGTPSQPLAASPRKKLSLIVAVLESYEVVRRQLLHLERLLTPDCELILVDDGSVPSLEATCNSVKKSFSFSLHLTYDRRPWTQPRARNIGADCASAGKLLFFDIDHIVTREIIDACLNYDGDKLHWTRLPGILNEEGEVVTDRQVLEEEYGLKDGLAQVHWNSFMIRRQLFEQLGGYDERFCGQYGGDDIDFNERYEALCRQGLAKPAEVRGQGYVYPDPAHVKKLFHPLDRVPRPQVTTRGAAVK